MKILVIVIISTDLNNFKHTLSWELCIHSINVYISFIAIIMVGMIFIMPITSVITKNVEWNISMVHQLNVICNTLWICVGISEIVSVHFVKF